MTYQPKIKRWAHQNRALDHMNGSDAYALFMEMRTGKTKVILDEFGEDELNDRIHNLLVIAPAGVYRTWETDAAKHLSEDLKDVLKIMRWESKATPAVKQRLAAMAKTNIPGPKMLLMNVEALSTVREAQVLCTLFLTNGPTTIVLDESTTIKNYKAKRTKFCLRIAQLAKKTRILSGLPSPQSPLDLYSQFEFLKPGLLGFATYDRFQQQYAIMDLKPFGPGGRLRPIVVGYQNLDDLQRRIQPYSFRVRLAECYDLPDKMYLRHDVELTKEQEKHYDEMLQYATTVLENTERVTATIVLTQLLRLHQILCGHTKSDNGVVTDIPENRTAEMLDILEQHEGKAIIWTAYDQDVRKISAKLAEVYGEESVARFWGGNVDTREDEEKQFKTNPRCRFMVATAAAGGRGRTWDVADLVIYHSNTFSLEHRMQSEERAQAVGKKGSVAYFDLSCANTVEDKIISALLRKKNLSDAITGDEWRQWIV